MSTITVLIQAFNEQKNLPECIKSARLLSDTIIVIDTESKDKTVSVAKKEGATVYSAPYSHYVEPVRKMGIQKVTTEWVFILDADERITSELAQEIKKKIKEEKFSYFKVPRKNIFGGEKWLEYGGWSPDYQLRLIKLTDFIDWPARIHATPEIKGEGGYLEHKLLHNFHPNLKDMVAKTITFEQIESDLLYKAKKPVHVSTFFRKYFGELWRRLILKQGFRDGTYGIIESMYQAFSKTITYLFLYEKYKKSRSI